MSAEQNKRRRRTTYIWKPEMIRALREHMDLTQRELADLLEVRQQTISEWETGLHTPHRSTQKTLTMVAERAGFPYLPKTSETPADSDSSQQNGEETAGRVNADAADSSGA
ncbi:MAG: helix-turn-helix transcriptional regulator [Roseiflexus sp.]|nr:helix-turn-helix transcriptional regulator [Roseiflexus sp.]MCS7289514.1 helix-turn-helix transcriptional regulator [Roseiflexus sp.]MDW8233496.1 helix-turn-helix transcriptional regulator [Roseiflexaceae bacterium]